MRKLLATGVATLFAVSALAVTTVPANAGGISFGFGSGFSDDWDDWDDDGDIVIEVPMYDMDDDDDDDDTAMERHKEWCEAQYQTYDEDTDLYFYAPGKQRHCVSPFS